MFNEVRNVSDEGTMNIYVYQKLYRNKLVKEPMPHLFIISDEFAELKQQRPEFMDQLISMARIGRSLGIHLILATQKPAGVVNDQIRSNTKFRVCLKVQDKNDSMDMLKRPEAAELKETGRFYLQVGYNEYFAMGQSAWSGAPYEPADEVAVQQDDSIQLIDSVGANIVEVKQYKSREMACGAQLVSVVKMLSDVAAENNIIPKQLWKPELPRKLDLAMLYQQNRELMISKPGQAALGILDDPETQEQFTLVFDFVHSGNLLIVGEKGSGKTTLIQSILYSLTNANTPEKINYYILDYSSRMMKLFCNLPHCGGVLLEEDASLLDSFFELISSITDERKKLFSELEVDNYDAANAVHPIPLILVVIDNFAGLSASKSGEKHGYKLQSYIRDSANYGIKFIISCSHLNEIASRIKQELGDHICLRMRDKYDYSEALGCRVSYSPTEMPGRGLYNWNGRALEMQIAMYRAEADDRERLQQLKTVNDRLNELYRGFPTAQRLPVISETETYEQFAKQFKMGRIPLGYSLDNAKTVALPLKQFSAISVYFGNTFGVKPVLSNFIHAASQNSMDAIIIKRATKSVITSELLDEKIVTVDCTPDSLASLCEPLYNELVARQNVLIDYYKKHEIDYESAPVSYDVSFQYMLENTKPLFLIFESFMDVCKNADDLTVEYFSGLFARARKANIYIVGCFYPNTSDADKRSRLYREFNQDNLFMLFGGQLDQQPYTNRGYFNFGGQRG